MRRERTIGMALVGLTLAGRMPAAADEDRPVDFPPNPLEKPGWVLTAHDEFDGVALNTDLWVPYYLEYRTERERAAARYELRDGHLVLRIDQDQPLYSGRDAPRDAAQMRVSSVQTGQRDYLHKPTFHHSTPTEMKFTQQYGYFEIRAKTFNQPGYCIAFWTVGVRDEPWQESEIDITEQPGNSPFSKFNLYRWGDSTLQDKVINHNLEFRPDQSFNIYALEWDETSLRKYLNNELVSEIPQSPSYPMVFFLSVYENPGWTGVADTRPDSGYPKEFVIDYFRAYERDPNYKPVQNEAAGNMP